jgi:agmatinase
MYLYTENPLKFAFSHDFEESNQKDSPYFGILGVPFDSTTTYQPGARFGPFFVREASYNFEKYNIFSDKILDANVSDIGNLEVVPGNLEKTCTHLESVISSMSEDGLIPLTIGGEHSLSYGVINSINAQITCRMSPYSILTPTWISEMIIWGKNIPMPQLCDGYMIKTHQK